MKRIALIFILIFSLSFLCGCDKKEDLVIKDDYILLCLDNSSNGMITQELRFGINSKKINTMSKSLKEELEFKKNLFDNISELRNEFLFGFALKYIDNPIEEYKINSGVILTDVYLNQKSDCIGFDIVFTSQNAFNYYNSKVSTQEDTKKDKNRVFLFKKVENRGAFPFSSTVSRDEEEISIGEIYREKYLTSAKGLSFEGKLKEEYQPQYLYDYSTFSSQIKSNGSVYRGADNKIHHLWTDKTTEIYLYVNIINRGMWVLLTLAIALAICLLSCMIILIRRKIKSKK